MKKLIFLSFLAGITFSFAQDENRNVYEVSYLKVKPGMDMAFVEAVKKHNKTYQLIMNKEYIEFRKQSDFSGILTDTFGFIRNEFKPLMKTIFNVAGPAILIFMLSLAAYNYIAGDIFDFDSFGDLSYNSGSIFATVIAAICYFISSIAAYILTTSAVLYYIKSYIDHKGETDLADIKRNAYKNFWSFFGLSFLQGLTIIISLMLCVLPFFYAMVPMAVVFSIFVFETKRSTTDAYSQAFTLVNEDFWTAFGAIIVIGIIYFVGGNVFTFVASLYTMVGTGIFAYFEMKIEIFKRVVASKQCAILPLRHCGMRESVT